MASSAMDLGESQFVTARDGLRLHVRRWGDADASATPVFCIHGLTRNSRDFAGIATHAIENAKTKRRFYALDLRGRGLSGYDKDWQNYNLFTELDDVISALTALGIEHAIFLGTSRGGLLTMMLSAGRPGAIKAAILNDIGPVIDGAGLTQIRLYLQKAPMPSSMEDAIDVQKSIMSKNFTVLLDEHWRFEAEARYREIDGKLRADYDPEIVKTVTSVDLNTPIPTLWPQFAGLGAVPVMSIRGQNSSLLSEQTVAAMGKAHPGMVAFTAEGQGHAPMLHVADVADGLVAFLDGLKH
ncbi:MAG: alpha/beta hydrolase [Pseudomonadota bacterium]